MSPIQCDHFRRCSSNICPLDESWNKRKHLNGERVCFYLIQAHKVGAKAIFNDAGKGDLYKSMANVGVDIIARHYPIKHVVENGKKTALRMKFRENQEAASCCNEPLTLSDERR